MKPPLHLLFVRTPAPECLPRDLVHPLADEAVIDERILGGLQRRSA